MAARTGSRRWWTLAILPAMAVSACGGSRLSHDAIVTALNGGPASVGVAAQLQQSQAQSAVTDVPQSGAVSSAPGSGPAVGGVGGTRTGGAHALGGTSSASATPGAATVGAAAMAAGPLAPIVIGNVGNYSGPAGSSDDMAPVAIRVWGQWVNAHGGIAGHPVQVYTADDGGDPARSRSLIQDMVENKHVIAFVGNSTPLTADAGVPYLEQRHIPIVGGDLTTSQWTSSPVFFPGGTTFFSILEATLKAAHAAGATKVGVFYCVETPACETINRHVSETAARYGEQVVYTARISLTQPDFTAQCLGAQQAGAQAVWLGADSGSHERIASSCTRQNYHPLWLTSAQPATNQEAQNPALDGMVAATPVFPWMVPGGSPELDAYNQAMRQYAPDVALAGFTAIEWAAGELFRKAAAGVGTVPGSDAIFNGLWALRNETLGGLTPPLTYAAHQPAGQITCFFIAKISGGRWTAPNGAGDQCL